MVAAKEQDQEVMEDRGKQVLTNSEILINLTPKLNHMTEEHQQSLINLIQQYKSIFKDAAGLTSVLKYNVILEEGMRQIKQHPYQLNPCQKEVVRREVDYTLQHHVFTSSINPWSLLFC